MLKKHEGAGNSGQNLVAGGGGGGGAPAGHGGEHNKHDQGGMVNSETTKTSKSWGFKRMFPLKK
jgi:hypothetical protein